MLGKCFSCSKIRPLITQTNHGITRKMCQECCEAANQVESILRFNRADEAQAKYVFGKNKPK